MSDKKKRKREEDMLLNYTRESVLSPVTTQHVQWMRQLQDFESTLDEAKEKEGAPELLRYMQTYYKEDDGFELRTLAPIFGSEVVQFAASNGWIYDTISRNHYKLTNPVDSDCPYTTTAEALKGLMTRWKDLGVSDEINAVATALVYFLNTNRSRQLELALFPLTNQALTLTLRVTSQLPSTLYMDSLKNTAIEIIASRRYCVLEPQVTKWLGIEKHTKSDEFQTLTAALVSLAQGLEIDEALLECVLKK